MLKIIKAINKEFFFLFLIVLFAAALRFWNLTGVPPSLSHDEVAIGYNAYSVLNTGKDEYGVSFPLLFRSFDDYKLPGMIYASIPTIKIFGLNELGVRFPSAFFGTFSVFLFFTVFGIFTSPPAETKSVAKEKSFNFAEILPFKSFVIIILIL